MKRFLVLALLAVFLALPFTARAFGGGVVNMRGVVVCELTSGSSPEDSTFNVMAATYAATGDSLAAVAWTILTEDINTSFAFTQADGLAAFTIPLTPARSFDSPLGGPMISTVRLDRSTNVARSIFIGFYRK